MAKFLRIWLVILGVVGLLPVVAAAVEHVVLQRDGQRQRVSGKVVTEAEDGGVLLCDAKGVFWFIEGKEIVERSPDDGKPFQPLTADQMAAVLLAEMPAGFQIHKTAHYTICYNTTPAYAQWCGALFERLYKGFYTYWSHLGYPLHPPELPLVALVFDSRQAYARHVSRELGGQVGRITGFYNMQTNRIHMYDLTGIEGVRRPPGRIGSAARINQILSQPAAEPMVANIVHEATHQLAYNSGLQTRFAANPFWVSEGLAVYFETPDLSSSRGWRGIGAVNQRRLARFHAYLPHRPKDSLRSLLGEDKRFRDPAKAADAYAEAWALNYYLLRTRKSDYVAYLRKLATKPPLVEDDAPARITEFKSFFGSDLDRFDQQFVRYMLQQR